MNSISTSIKLLSYNLIITYLKYCEKGLPKGIKVASRYILVFVVSEFTTKQLHTE